VKPAQPDSSQRLGQRQVRVGEGRGAQPEHPADCEVLPSNFGEAIRLRLRQITEGKTIRAIAAETEMCPETVRRYLNGSACSIEFLAKVCVRYGVDAEWLLFGRGRTQINTRSPSLIEECGARSVVGEIARRWARMESRMAELSLRLDSLDGIPLEDGPGRDVRSGDPASAPERTTLFIRRSM